MDHFCYYSIVRKTLKECIDGNKWVERCRCGRLIHVDQITKIINGRSIPTVHKVWFNIDGTIWKKTGENESTNQPIIPDHSSTQLSG